VNDYLCRGCERCAEVCEFGAIEFTEREGKASPFNLPGPPIKRKVAQVNPVMCKGCGACAVVCPTCAMQAAHFSSEQVTAMIQAALGG
jgi:heterodisulfide reductase subunit A